MFHFAYSTVRIGRSRPTVLLTLLLLAAFCFESSNSLSLCFRPRKDFALLVHCASRCKCPPEQAFFYRLFGKTLHQTGCRGFKKSVDFICSFYRWKIWRKRSLAKCQDTTILTCSPIFVTYHCESAVTYLQSCLWLCCSVKFSNIYLNLTSLDLFRMLSPFVEFRDFWHFNTKGVKRLPMKALGCRIKSSAKRSSGLR